MEIIILSLVTADLIVGFFHWLEDTYCADGLPVVGELICYPNIDHHIDPNDMREGNVISRNWIQWSLSAAVLLITWAIFGSVSMFWILTMFLVSWANEVHAWQHGAVDNAFTRYLFDAGIIQSKASHGVHHKPPYTSRYCILLQFNNAWLDRLNVFRILESIIRYFGLNPQRENRRDYEVRKM